MHFPTNKSCQAHDFLINRKLRFEEFEMGKRMAANAAKNKAESSCTVLLTHLHPDHTEGIPFFGPVFIPSWQIDFMGLPDVAKGRLLPEHFPITDDDLGAKRSYSTLHDRQIFFIDQHGKAVEKEPKDPIFKIQVMRAFVPSHPAEGAVYYRVTDPQTGRSAVCAWDLESHIGGDKRVIAFARGADVLIHDSQYTDDEYRAGKMGWGHSTYEYVLDAALKAGVRKLALFHHDPNSNDELLDRREVEYRAKIKPPAASGLLARADAARLPAVVMAREGMTLEA
jgi:phosphoribosyl 1,2-cyclic phosphodiesterase